MDVEIAGQIDALNKFIKMKPQHSVGVSRVAAAEGGLVKAEADDGVGNDSSGSK